MKVFVDKLPALRARHLNGYTRVINQIEEAEALGYCTQLKAGATELASGDFTLAGLQYHCRLLTKELGFYPLLLEWRDARGTARSEKVYLEPKKSRLKGYYFHFICPFSGRLTTKLLADPRGYLASRVYYQARGLHYATQIEKESRAKSRPNAIAIGHTISLINLENRDPYRKRGKVHYRGRLTPYGKRLEKYEQEHARLEEESLKDMPYLVEKCGIGLPLLYGLSRG